MLMRLAKEYHVNDSEHKRKEKILINLNTSTNKLQDISPTKAIPAGLKRKR